MLGSPDLSGILGSGRRFRAMSGTTTITNLPRIITSGEEMRLLVQKAQRVYKSVGVIPTMGALHAGHLSLVDAARRECDVVVATVFVNPTQFAPGEDFEKYPRDLDQDAGQLAKHGCGYIFAPSTDEMYPDGFETSVQVGQVAQSLEGERRPTHFAGVATVVLKLLQLVPAELAYFGRKDYQQTLVVQRMLTDLNLPTELRVCPTVREEDGLAMSSRNAYLKGDERKCAAEIYASLRQAKAMIAGGETQVANLQSAVRQQLDAVGGIEVDYVVFVRAGTVQQVESIDGPTVALIAAHVGGARLIDNLDVA